MSTVVSHSPSYRRAATRSVASATISRRELAGWAWLGVAALAIAGLFAVLLAFSRLPGVEKITHWPIGFFGNALVIHVIFSLVIWLMAIFGLLVASTTAELADGQVRGGMLGALGQGLVAASFPCLFVPAFLESSAPELTNYIPLIRHPAYDAGLVLLALGVLAPVLRMFMNFPGAKTPYSAKNVAIGVGGAIYVVALVCFVTAGLQLQRSGMFDRAREYLFWGGGHALQFVYVCTMVAIWSIVARASFGPSALSDKAVKLSALALGVASLSGIAFFVVFDAFSPHLHEAFRLLQYALALPGALFVAALAATLSTARQDVVRPWRQPAFVTLATSLACYGVGGVMGILISGSDTRTPAHYHAMVTAVSVACMGLLLTWGLETLGRRPVSERVARFLILCYGGGQIFASIGLFLAGGYGAPRKTPAGAAQMVDGAVVGMYLHGFGALFAVIGGATFVVVAIRALLRASSRSEARPATA